MCLELEVQKDRETLTAWEFYSRSTGSGHQGPAATLLPWKNRLAFIDGGGFYCFLGFVLAKAFFLQFYALLASPSLSNSPGTVKKPGRPHTKCVGWGRGIRCSG